MPGTKGEVELKPPTLVIIPHELVLNKSAAQSQYKHRKIYVSYLTSGKNPLSNQRSSPFIFLKVSLLIGLKNNINTMAITLNTRRIKKDS